MCTLTSNSTGVKNAWNYISIPCNFTGPGVINNFELKISSASEM